MRIVLTLLLFTQYANANGFDDLTGAMFGTADDVARTVISNAEFRAEATRLLGAEPSDQALWFLQSFRTSSGTRIQDLEMLQAMPTFEREALMPLFIEYTTNETPANRAVLAGFVNHNLASTFGYREAVNRALAPEFSELERMIGRFFRDAQSFTPRPVGLAVQIDQGELARYLDLLFSAKQLAPSIRQALANREPLHSASIRIYFGEHVEQALTDRALRAYIFHPNYVKDNFPRVAAMLRDCLRTNDRLALVRRILGQIPDRDFFNLAETREMALFTRSSPEMRQIVAERLSRLGISIQE